MLTRRRGTGELDLWESHHASPVRCSAWFGDPSFHRRNKETWPESPRHDQVANNKDQPDDNARAGQIPVTTGHVMLQAKDLLISPLLFDLPQVPSVIHNVQQQSNASDRREQAKASRNPLYESYPRLLCRLYEQPSPDGSGGCDRVPLQRPSFGNRIRNFFAERLELLQGKITCIRHRWLSCSFPPNVVHKLRAELARTVHKHGP